MSARIASAFLALAVAACGGSSTPAPVTPGPDLGSGSTATPAPAPAPAPAPVQAVGKPREGLIPRAVLFGNPQRGEPELSPDGKRVAYAAPADGVMNVFVAPAGDLAKAVQVTHDKTRPIRQYFWSLDSKWLLYMQDVGGDENFHLFRVGVDGKDPVDLTPKPGARAQVFGMSPRHPGVVMVGVNDRNPQLHDVWRIDLASGKAEVVLENPGYAGFTFDQDLKVRFGQKFEPDGSVAWFTPPRGKAKEWTEYDRVGADDQLTTAALGFDRSGKRYYAFDSRGRNTAGLYLVDVRTKKKKLLAEDPRADVSGALVHPTTGAIRAVSFNYTRREWKVIDRSVAKDLAALAELDEGELSISSMTLDDKVWIVKYEGDRRPVRFWRWDRKAGKGTFLYAARPGLEDLTLARMTPEVIKARDGLELVSYLSLPPASDPDGDGRPDQALPAVLLVHGGPWARDDWGYHPVVQLLANRGYAVLQVNYRGSTGLGKEFTNAGNREWGKKMHDDLIDARTWLVAGNIAAEGKVCIAGGSYGGYATLAGLTLTPKAFACGVDIVGPSNIETLVKSIPPYWAPLISVFKIRVGDWTTPEGMEMLKQASPLTHAAKIERPLLIGQGANDPRVKQAESDQIVSAMQAKQLPVSYVLFPDEGHGFARPENMQAFMAVTEAFLSAHLGGGYQPMTEADFTGSTIQVRAGREGIPGLPATVGQVPAK